MAAPLDPHAAFLKAYESLNAAQRQAVDAVEGPVMVIAGPGTGKTQILALRIANILRVTDTAPQNILALTFTESGVASMRARLVSLIGERGYRVPVYTFHGFCNEVLSRYPDRFPDISHRVPQTELDAVLRIRRILDELRPPLLRPHGKPDLYVRDIIRAISEAKREHVSPAQLRERISARREQISAAPDFQHEKGAHAGKVRGHYLRELQMLEKADACADVYERYEADLAASDVYDFEDTIIRVVETLARDTELKYLLQEEYQYILADEHQDANGGQNELLTLLADFHAQPNLFVVGDEKQAIYRFQGASLENFTGFRLQYPDALIVPLIDNYRSTQIVLDAAHTLIGPAPSGIERERLVARAAGDAVPVRVVVAEDSESECTYVADRIAALVSEGTPPREIAVLARRNRDLDAFAAALRTRAVPYAVRSGDSVLDDPLVVGFVDLLRAIECPGDDARLSRALLLPYSGVSSVDNYRLTARPARIPGALLARLSDAQLLSELGVEDIDACLRASAFMTAASREAEVSHLGILLEDIFARSGALAYSMSRPDALSAIETMRAFFSYVSELTTAHPAYRLGELIAALDEARAYALAHRTAAHAGEAVMLMTAHRAKGMEFDHVFIPQMDDRRWGAGRSTSRLRLPIFAAPDTAAAGEDDERRLLYVAMTRPRRTLTLSYARTSDDGATQLPSRFLGDVDPAMRVELSAVAGTHVPSMPTAPSDALSAHERAYLRQRFIDTGLSVSALNNYLESPWKYFCMNLIRIPHARPPHLLYGSAIDEALKWYTDVRKDGAEPTPDELVSVFTAALSKQPLAQADYQHYAERGATALSGYVAAYGSSWCCDTQSAVRIAIPFETGLAEAPTLTLRGELDKIEYRNGVVCVVDYKTGAPKTRGVIEGTTKHSNGNLKRQLVFYRLLLQNDPQFASHAFGDSTLDFVEPDARGRYRRESFVITDAEVAELAAVIRQCARAILAVDFWGTPCDRSAWEGCELAERIMHRRGIPQL